MRDTATRLGLAVLTLMLPVLAASAGGQEEPTRELPFNPGDVLELRFPQGGSARIEGWDESKLSVSWSDRVGGTENVDVRVRERDGGLLIENAWIRETRSNSFRCEIRVPRRVDVEFHSGGGGLTLEGLEGIFTGSTGGGSLTLEDVVGEVKLATGGGEIEVKDCRLDGKLTTGGGEVILENVVGDLEATSGGGNVQYLNVRDQDGRIRGPADRTLRSAGEETVLITSAGGKIDVREAPAGAEVTTGGGDVTVRGASRFVSARTGGGDVRVEIEDGWVDATTGAGDVEIEVTRGLGEAGKGIEVLTGTGDVTLIVPPGLSLDLDLEVAYTRNSKRDYRIDSDLDVRTERTDDWDFARGTPRKYIRGTAKIEGGRHPVKVRTVNGDIHLRTKP